MKTTHSLVDSFRRVMRPMFVAALLLGVAAAPATAATVRDDFSSQNYNLNTGDRTWAGAWNEDDPQGGGASSGSIKIYGGHLKLSDRPDSGGYPSIYRCVDLSDCSSATLRFDFGTPPEVDDNDQWCVMVKAAGGSWTVLEVFTGQIAGSREYDISNFISSATCVKFQVENLFGGSDEWAKIDYVEIECDGGTPPTAEDYCVEDTRTNCGSGEDYGMWIPNIDPAVSERTYDLTDARFEQHEDGTARLTATATLSSGEGFAVDVHFSGRTSTPPAGSPKTNSCSPDPDIWYYYPAFTGTLTGLPGGVYAGAVVSLQRRGEAFQVGIGANMQTQVLGGSGWFDWWVDQEPSGSINLNNDGHGDFNFELVECGNGSIGDFVWHDQYFSASHQVDGIQDDGEPGIPGVVLNLIRGGSTIATTTTDGSGAYLFSDLPAGTYTVDVADSNFGPGGALEGWYASPQNAGGDDAVDSDGDETSFTATTTLSAGEHDPTLDFGFFTTCIELEKTGPTSVSLGETITYTFTVTNCGDLEHRGGARVFDALIEPANDHRIWYQSPLKPGESVTFTKTYTPDANDCGDLVNIAQAVGHPRHPDGYYLPNVVAEASWTTEVVCVQYGNLGDFVWCDLDCDGIQDDGEPGVEGVVLNLWRDNDRDGVFEPGGPDELIDTTTTEANGEYAFNDIPIVGQLCDFFVQVDDANFEPGAALENKVGAPKDQGGNDHVDSDIDPETLVTMQIELASSGSQDKWDFGFCVDCEPPTVVGPPDEDLGCNPAIPPADPSLIHVTGGCGDVSVVHVGDDVTADGCTVTRIRTYRATDADGNTADWVQVFTYEVDTEGPVFSDDPEDLFLECNLPPYECGDCDGKVTALTLRYDGDDAANITVVQKKDAVTVFSGLVTPGSEFSFEGTDNGTLSTEITIFVNGVQREAIHTSCSQPIGVGQVFGDFTITDGYSRNGGRLCPAANPGGCEECDGGVTYLSLVYNGDAPAQVVVFDDDATYFNGLVEPGVPFDFSGTRSDGRFEKNNLEVTVNGALNAEIHVSCSQPIGIGSIFGDFTVEDGSSRNGGTLCPITGGGACDDCDGGVTMLALRYNGGATADVVVQDDDATYFDGPVMPGQVFAIAGTRADGKFEKNNLELLVNGALDTEIHVSCSQPIAAGMDFGSFTVVAGESRDGGPLCSVSGGNTVPPPPMITATDNCDDEVVVLFTEEVIEDTDCALVILRTWTAVDSCGNSNLVDQLIVIGDNLPPVLEGVPEDATLGCNEPWPEPPVVTATDNCEGDVPVDFVSEVAVDGCYEAMVRIWTAIDSCGNEVSESQTLTRKVDNEAPVLTGVPADTVVECIDEVPVPVEVTALDNCDGQLEVFFAEEADGATCPLTITRTWSATDACGNDVSASQTIVVDDTIAPVLAGVPDDVVIGCNDPEPPAPDVTATDNCDGDIAVFAASSISFNPETCEEIIGRRWTAVDACGNEATATQTITRKVDNEAPVLSGVPDDTTVQCADDVPVPADVTALDNCDGLVPVSFSETSDGRTCPETITRTWSAVDACGNDVSASQTILVDDTTPPTIVCPPDLTIECNTPSDPSVTGEATASDNCGGSVAITFADEVLPGDEVCPQGGQILRTWTATDACGNSADCVQTITVVDTTPPTIVCPADLTIACEDPSDPSATGEPTGSDNCGTVTFTFTDEVLPGDEQCPDAGRILRTWTATDECGNRADCVQTITIVDTTPPTIVCPPDLTIECDAPSDPSATGEPTGSDNCGDVTFTFVDEVLPGDEVCPQGGLILRTWTATDDCGNSADCVQTITIVDTTPPTIVCPPDLTIECDAPSDPSATGEPTGNDNCGNVTFTFMDELLPGDEQCPQGGLILRTWTATDECGNSADCVQTITIVDTTPPTIVCPPDLTIECDAPSDPAATGEPTGSDNCGNVTFTFVDEVLPGDEVCPQGGLILRTWTATDECGNSADCVQTITIVDTTPPTIVCPADLTIACEDPSDPSATGEPTGSDNCGTVTFTFADEVLPGDEQCPDAGRIVRTWTATDECGNSADCVQTITIVDTTPPTIVCPPDLTIECNTSSDPSATGEPTGSDNCGDVTFTFVDEVLPGDEVCPQGGLILRTWTATDDCGNSADCVQTITIVDTTPPTIVCPPDATVECDASTDPSHTGEATGDDNCGTVTLTFSDEVFPGDEQCPQGGLILRTWTATDECGNSADCVQTITIVDTTPPTIVCPADLTIECNTPSDPSVTGEPTGGDNCGTVTFTFEDDVLPGDEQCPQGGLILRTWTATDDCGNSSECVQTITIVDTTPPSIVCPPDITINCDLGSADPSVTGEPTGSDNCGTVTFTFEDETSAGGGECPNGGLVLRTWTATDECGNSATCVQTITIDDSTPPTMVCPPDLTIECDASTDPSNTGEPTGDDNCGLVVFDFTDEALPGDEQCPQGGLILRTWTASDACGNSTSCVQTITLVDTTPPTIVCPPDLTIECDASTDPSNTGEATGDDNCGTVTLTFEDEVLPGDEQCPQGALILRTWTATDECGNSADCVQTITVVDTTPPSIVCPPDLTIECDTPSDPSVTGEPTGSDNCGPVTFDFTDETLPGDEQCPQGVLILRTWTATDDCGNRADCVQTITVVDTTPPSIVCPPDLTIQCSAPSDPAATGEPTGSDNCGAVTFTFEDEVLPGDEQCPEAGRILRTWTATDDCGNSDSCVQTITLVDDTPPSIVCPPDVTIECDASTDPSNTGEPTGSDNCGTVTFTFSDEVFPGDEQCPQGGLIVRTWTATDSCGNSTSCEQTIVVVDTVAPTIMAQGTTLSQCEAILELLPHQASDTCSDVTVTQDPAPGTALPVGDTPVTLTATDECGNSDSVTVTVTVTPDTTCGIKIVKDVTPSVVADTNTVVTYSFFVNNTGGLPIGNVVVSDDQCANVTFLGGDDNGNNLLEATETWAYECSRTYTWEPGEIIVNVACVDGVDLAGTPVSDCDDAELLTVGINVEKIAEPVACEGEEVTFTLITRLLSDSPRLSLTNVMVVDEFRFADGTTQPCELDFVESSDIDNSGTINFVPDGQGGFIKEEWTNLCISALSQTVTNYAMDMAEVLLDGEATGLIVSNSDEVVVQVVSPGLAVSAEPQNQTVVPGDDATYTLTVINTGNADATDVAITHSLASGCNVTIPVIPAGGSAEHVCTIPSVLANTTDSVTVDGTWGPGCTETETISVTVNVTTSPPPQLVSCKTATPEGCDEVLIELCAKGIGEPNLVRVPVDIMLVLDRSGSMTGEGITAAKAAATDLINHLDPQFDRVGLVSYSGSTAPTPRDPSSLDARLDIGLTTDYTSVIGEVNDLTPFGFTCIQCGVDEGTAELLANARPEAQKVMIFLTDGVANRYFDGAQVQSCANAPTVHNDCTLAAIAAANAAKDSGVVVYSIGLNLDQVEATFPGAGQLALDTLGQMASDLGKFFDSPDPSQLDLIFEQIVTEIQNIAGRDVLLVEVLPDGLTYIPGSGMPEPSEIMGQTMIWDLGIVAIDATNCVTFRATVENPGPNTLVDVYPDSGILYTNLFGEQAFVPFDETYVDFDDQPPAMTCPDPITVECRADVPPPADNLADFELLGGTAIDPTGPVTVRFVSDVSDGLTCPETITRTYEASDACSNATTCTQIIVVDDVSAPVLAGVPGDVMLGCNEPLPPPVEVTATDNCDETVVVVDNETQAFDPQSCIETVTRTWDAMDACGNSTTAVQVITRLIDTQMPELVGVPADLDVECIEDVPLPADVTALDNCDGLLGASLTETSDGQSCPETITRTWTAVDGCGNVAQASQTITVNDVTAPVLAGVPADLDLPCNGAIPEPATVTATDNCDETVAVIDNETQGFSPETCIETITRTWDAMDACGNVTSATQVITRKVDTIAPELSDDPADLAVECIEDVPAPAILTATDNCDGDVLVSFSETTDEQTCPETITRTWTAVDECGNVASVSQTITVNDETAPVLAGVPADLDLPCNGAIPEPAVVTATDNCDETVAVIDNETQGFNPETCIETITRTWDAMDACGNVTSATQVITRKVDTIAPELSDDPADLAVECIEDVPAPAILTATDNCDGDVLVSFSETTDEQTCPETITRTWTAVDECGNVASVTQTITVDDTTPPELTAQADLTLGGDELCNVTVPELAFSVSDNCDENVMVTQDPAAGTTLTGPGTFTVTLTAVDDCGNTATDTVDIMVMCDAGLGDFVWLDRNADGIQDPGEEGIEGVTVQLLDAAGTVIGSTMTDSNGFYSFMGLNPDTYGVQFVVPPGFMVSPQDANGPSDDTNDSNPDMTGRAPNTTLGPNEFDPTIDAGLFEKASLGDRVWFDTNGDGIQDPNEDGVDGIRVILEDCEGNELSSQVTTNGGFYLFEDLVPGDYRVTFVLPDGFEFTLQDTPDDDAADSDADRTTGTSHCVNLESGDVDLTVDAGLVCPPVITCPPDVTLECGPDADTSPEATGMPTAEACCDIVSTTFADTIDTTPCGTTVIITREWTIEDACGQTDTCTQTITVVDTLPPVLIGVPADTAAECDAVPEPADVTADDACDPEVVVDFSEGEEGACPTILTRTWTATDACGNSTSATQVIVVNDTTAPVLDGVPDDLTLECDQAIPEPATVTATDNCDESVAVGFSETSEGTCPTVITRTWTAVDACGNDVSDSQTITVDDTIAPVIDAPPMLPPIMATAGIPDDPETCIEVVPDLIGNEVVTATDNCDESVTLSQSPAPGTLFTNSVVIVITATDDCGNSTELPLVQECTPSEIACESVIVRVFRDANNDGLFVDGQDNALAGVPVTLIDAATSSPVDTTATDTNGFAEFTRPAAGDYLVEVDESFVSDEVTLGDSFANPTGPFTYNPFDDDSCPDLLIGYRDLCDICGVVWFDADAQGDTDEDLAARGINGVTVNLVEIGSGQVVASAVTADGICERLSDGTISGAYRFENIDSGNYEIVVDLATVPADLSDFFDQEPDRAVTPRQSTTSVEYDLTCNPGPDAPDDPDFGFVQEPTAIELVSFTATAGTGGVTIDWVTAVEMENLGFNVYRSVTEDGDRVRINDQLILGSGSSMGRAYQLVDTSATPGAAAYYWLEDLDWNFESTIHGPAVVEGSDADNALATAVVADAGIYRISKATLAAAGVTLDASEIAVTLNGGEVAAFSTVSHGALIDGDYLLVYVPEGGAVIGVERREGASRMAEVDATPVDGEGETVTAAATAAGSLQAPTGPSIARHMLIGFTEPPVLIFDISNANAPKILYGYAILEVEGELGAYMSHPVDAEGSCLAVDENGIRDIGELQN